MKLLKSCILQLASVMATAPALTAMSVISVKTSQQESSVRPACQDIMGIPQTEGSVQVSSSAGRKKKNTKMTFYVM